MLSSQRASSTRTLRGLARRPLRGTVPDRVRATCRKAFRSGGGCFGRRIARPADRCGQLCRANCRRAGPRQAAGPGAHGGSRAACARIPARRRRAACPWQRPPDLDRLHHTRDSLVAGLQDHPRASCPGRQTGSRESGGAARAALPRGPTGASRSVTATARPAFDNMLTRHGLRLILPWQAERRQDRDVASQTRGAGAGPRAEREDARRMHEAEVRGWLADYDIAGRTARALPHGAAPARRERCGCGLRRVPRRSRGALQRAGCAAGR